MQRFDRRWMLALALAAALPALAACASSGVNLIPTPSLRPDWLSYSGHKEEFTLRQAGPADLVGPEGQCAAGRPEQAAEAAPGAPAAGGISLQMTECDVVNRLGTPDRVEFGSTERGERSAILTYTRGVRPGIYRFAGGRLASIERGTEPAPARQQKNPPQQKKRA